MIQIRSTPINILSVAALIVLSFGAVPAFSQVANQTHEQTEPTEEASQTVTRTFYEFNTGIPAFNVSLFPPDQFSQKTIEANQNDNVMVNFFNMEAPTGDRHSFTINAPYTVNLDLAPGKNGTVSFIAKHPGIYQFYCEYHEPTMTGQLVVLPKR
jgi:heme/copper-type cytochrome/quinol oxidase subunit 2